MPKIGEIRKGKDIGKDANSSFVFHACIDCGKERWETLVRKKPKNLRCNHCARMGTKNNMWRGGRYKAVGEYILVRIYSDDFFYPMTNKQGYVLEHRLVVAKALGRNLHLWEIVHHKHAKYPAGSVEDKQDNRYPENLQLVSDDRHTQITILEMQIKRLKEENKRLCQELKKYQ